MLAVEILQLLNAAETGITPALWVTWPNTDFTFTG